MTDKETEEEEELEFSNTAYAMFHRLNTEWPCLTLDVVRDDLGFNRTTVRRVKF
jgi:ribosome assembly protein RRB1